MFDILNKDEDFEKYLGTEVFVRFDVDPKELACRGLVRDHLQSCADARNKLKDGFYLLTKDDYDLNDYHRFSITVNDEVWSARHSYIKEVYGLEVNLILKQCLDLDEL